MRLRGASIRECVAV